VTITTHALDTPRCDCGAVAWAHYLSRDCDVWECRGCSDGSTRGLVERVTTCDCGAPGEYELRATDFLGRVDTEIVCAAHVALCTEALKEWAGVA
jgi:hypothetical protein